MGASITLAGESLISQKQSNREVLLVSKFVLANVPGLDTTLPVDRAAGLPVAEHIVHSVPVTREGYLATNKVVYSLMLGSDIGDFDFNWIGLVSAEDVLVITAYVPRQQKRKEIPPLQAGNNLTRNIILEYDGAQSLTGISVPASSWQFDFTADFTAINAKIDLLQVELDKKVDLETWTPPAAVSLDGPVLVYPGSTNAYKITDYNRFSVFTASTTLGTVSVAADVVTLVIPTVAAAGLLTLDVLRDGNKASFRLPVGAASIVPPTLTSPLNLATGVALDLVLTATPFEVFPAGYDQQVSRRWQIATDEAFAQVVFDRTSTTDLTSIRPSDYDFFLPPGKRLYARAWDIGETLQSDAPVATAFNTATTYIRRPSLIAPLDGQTGVSGSVTLLSDAFSVYGGADIHIMSRFQIALANDGTAIVQDSAWSAASLTSYKPAANLANITQFYARVKYRGQALGETEWSPFISFKTADKLHGVYTSLSSGGVDRMWHAMTSHAGFIYVFGGGNSTGYLGDLWRYDPTTNAWQQLASTTARAYCSMVAIAGKLYVFGGGTSGTTYTNDLWCYDIAKNSWTKLVPAASPVARYNTSMVALDGKIYLYGGNLSASGFASDLWCFDPGTTKWTQLLSNSPGRAQAIAGVIAGEIYFANGSQANTGAAKRVAKYNPVSNIWVALADFAGGYLWQTGAAVADKLYLFGGRKGGDTAANGDLFEYDPGTDQWTQLPSAAVHARESAASCELNGKLYVSGGTYGNGGTKTLLSIA